MDGVHEEVHGPGLTGMFHGLGIHVTYLHYTYLRTYIFIKCSSGLQE